MDDLKENVQGCIDDLKDNMEEKSRKYRTNCVTEDLEIKKN